MNHISRQYRGLFALALGVVLLVTVVSAPAAAHTGDDGFHHHDGWMGASDGLLGSLWMALWMVVLLAVPLALVYLLLTRRESGGERTDDALAVLRRRYAEGDIDEEEFGERRRKLQGGE